MLYTFFAFLVVVALAAIGLIEWYKSLVAAWDKKGGERARALIIAFISIAAALSAGVAAVLSGLFKAYSLTTLAGGIFIGLIAVGFVELAYQLVVQVFIEAAKAGIRSLRSIKAEGASAGGGMITGAEGVPGPDGASEAAEGAGHPIGFTISGEPQAKMYHTQDIIHGSHDHTGITTGRGV